MYMYQREKERYNICCCILQYLLELKDSRNCSIWRKPKNCCGPLEKALVHKSQTELVVSPWICPTVAR